MKLIYSFLLFLFIAFLCVQPSRGENPTHYTIIVSLGGFRWDYPEKYTTPHLDDMARKGVRAVMRPSYPSSTFPNHYTLITGLVPDHHGIINNSFWDIENNRAYSMGDSLTRNDPAYYKGEPIWATAQRQGVPTGSIYWVGSDIPIRDTYPTYYKVWADEPRLTFAQRVDTALAWLQKPEPERPRLITLYMDEPDGAGHRSGPGGKETAAVVQQLDSLIGHLIQGIDALPFSDQVNLIVTSDHGMTDVSSSRFITIDEHLNPAWYDRVIGSNPSFIFAKPQFRDSVYQALSQVEHI